VLDPSSPLPLYHQLASWIEARVDSGELAVGDRIESEPALAQRFGIGRPTVRQATELLVRRGLLERRRGAGTFVRPPHASVDLFGLGGTLASFEQSGIEVESSFVGGPRSQGHTVSLTRVHVHRQRPLVLERLELLGERFGVLAQRELSGLSLSRFVREELGLRLHEARQSFRVARAGRENAVHLDCSPSTPVLHVQRELFFGGIGRAITADLYCRTDKVLFSQTLKGDSL